MYSVYLLRRLAEDCSEPSLRLVVLLMLLCPSTRSVQFIHGQLGVVLGVSSYGMFL